MSFFPLKKQTVINGLCMVKPPKSNREKTSICKLYVPVFNSFRPHQIEKELPIYMTVWMNFTPLAAQEKTRYHVICIKRRCYLLHIAMLSASSQLAFCVTLPSNMAQNTNP